MNDVRTRYDEGVSRVSGAGKVVTGGVTAIGGTAAGIGLCTSGVGCAVGAPVAGISVVGGVSTAIEGKNQVFGEYKSQEGQKVIDSYNPNRKQELSQLSEDALNGAVTVAETVLLGKVGGKLSQGVKSEVKTTEKVAEKARAKVDNINDLGYPANSSKTAAQLRTELAFKDANVLDENGRLTQKAIDNSKEIELSDGVIRNPSIVNELTKDGSKIKDWGKYTTESVLMPNGQKMQIHFYKNNVTGKIDYVTPDFKVKGIVQQ